MARAARQLKLSGVIAAAVTPHRDGSEDPDYSACFDLLDVLTAGGARAICLLDAVGEFFNYGYSDRQRLVYLADVEAFYGEAIGVASAIAYSATVSGRVTDSFRSARRRCAGNDQKPRQLQPERDIERRTAVIRYARLFVE